jgi:diguanylate cyclase (GGDEF)-like protein/PAS domain S-box-containing protein
MQMRFGKELMNELKENSNHYLALFKNYPDAVFIIDSLGNIVDINQSGHILFGLSENELLETPIIDLIHEHDRQLVESLFYKVLKGDGIETEIRGLHSSKGTITLHITAEPLYIDSNIMGVYGIAKDITERKEMECQFEISKERYKSLFEHHPDAVFTMDLKGRFVEGNQTCEQLTGYKWEDVKNYPFDFIIAREDLAKVKKHFQDAIRGLPQNYKCNIMHSNGKKLLVSITNVPIFAEGELKGIYGIAKDITEQVQLEKKVEHMAYHDYLTDLPNRWSLDKYYKKIQKTSQEDELNVIFFIDVDRFKMINDTFGYKAGDELIKTISNRLQSIFNDHFVARVGGDEFVALIRDSKIKKAEAIAKHLLKECRNPISIGGNEIYSSVSIGIHIINGGIESLDSAFKKASSAMKYAKKQGKNKYQFYTSEFIEFVNDKFLIEQKLRRAIEENQLSVFYQPKIELKNFQVVGVEALIRWKDDQLGYIPPGEFIPIAEEADLMDKISDFILDVVSKDLRYFIDKFNKPLYMCINLSPTQFLHENLTTFIEQKFHKLNLPLQLLDIEITESVAIKFLDEAIEKMTMLKRMGIKIALDDFGTGYSSLSYLKKLPIDILKIDRSFIKDIHYNPQDQAIFKAILTVANSLGLIVIAEGVECKEQLQILMDEGCPEVQGFYFSKPLPKAQLEKYLIKYLN